MRFKRLFSTALAAALMVGMLSLPVSAASFTDLDALPEVSEAAEFLRLMGVVNGVPGGSFNPAGTLSRAEFCAMAVRALDRADEEPAQRSRTIYLDVGPTFWATGYINLASVITLGDGAEKGGTPLVAGVGDGTFQPDRAITYGEAVTILCRMLGYGTADVATGGAWYDGYLAAGASAGLTDGLTLGGTDVITRAQAAILFYNLYFADVKGGKQTYLVSMGGKEQEVGILLDVNATLNDSPAVKTSEGTYKTDRSFDRSLEGKEGKAYFDADEKLIAFVPKKGTSQRVVNITSALATSFTISGGEKINIDPATDVYKDRNKTTWNAVWKDLGSSSTATLHYGSNGKLSRVYLPDSSADDVEAMVLRANHSGVGNPFSSLAGGSGYTMFKNGMEATAADIRQYDVATWDATAKVIQVSDLKLTGIYENAKPTPQSPTSVTLMGQEFTLLSSAWNDFDSFRIGDSVTLLLTADGKVAGAVSPSAVKGDAVGVATVSGTTAEVTLVPSGVKVKGEISSSSAERYNGQLVTVTSNAKERLSLSLVSGSAARADLDVGARKLGDREIAENAVIYDRVQNGQAVRVEYSDITQATVSKSRISFVSYDYAGRVRCMVLDDVTGNAYQYGYFYYEKGDEGDDYKNPDPLCVRQAPAGGGKEDAYSEKGIFLGSARGSSAGGVALATRLKTRSDDSGPDYQVVATVDLKPLTGVGRSAFDPEEMTVTVSGVSYPVSSAVQCYNRTTRTWFPVGKDGMEAARAYSDDLTLYYDRNPAEGGKIRLIIVP